MADLNHGIPITTGTVFYIASTSKQFAAASIALLSEAGTLSLSDPIRKWVPELPAYLQRVAIANLVHHTSGIRDYLGLWGLSGRGVADEIPQEVALDLIARQLAADFAPGEHFSYSNSGYLLLSEIVRRASGKSLRDFAAEKIFGPLGMRDTQFHDLNTRIVPRRAEGYQPKAGGGDRFEIVRTSFALVGDGGLLTTVEDLARWDANFYNNRLGAGGQTLITRLTTPPADRLGDGAAQRYAFGLMPGTYRGLDIVEHGGAFIGFRAQLLRFPSEHFSVAVLCNDYTAQPERMARQVADDASCCQAWSQPSARRQTGLVMEFMGQRLVATARSDSSFSIPEFSEPLVFASTAAGPTLNVPSLGMWSPAARLADPPRPSAASLAVYSGRYESRELDTWAEFKVEGSVLKSRMRWGAWLTAEPVAPDLFTASGARIEFVRKKGGTVSGFRLSQARTRNVRFDRMQSR